MCETEVLNLQTWDLVSIFIILVSGVDNPDPDQYQNVMTSSLAQDRCVHQMSEKSDRQTDRQIDRQTDRPHP